MAWTTSIGVCSREILYTTLLLTTYSFLRPAYKLTNYCSTLFSMLNTDHLLLPLHYPPLTAYHILLTAYYTAVLPAYDLLLSISE